MARGHRKFTITPTAGAAFAAIVSDTLGAAGWDASPTAGSITVESSWPSMTIAGAGAVWVQYAPALSVGPSPRGCYATGQYIHYDELRAEIHGPGGANIDGSQWDNRQTRNGVYQYDRMRCSSNSGIEHFLSTSRAQLKPGPEEFMQNYANQTFLHRLAFYVGTVTAKQSGNSIVWYNYDEMLRACPTLGR